MTRPAPRAEVLAFPRSRRVIVDIGRVTTRRATVSGLVEVDVTDARRRLRASSHPGRHSLTAYLVACVGRAVAGDRQVHAVRDLRGRLVQFDEVDVNVSVEVRLEGRSFPMNHVVRAADRRTVAAIGDELHHVKRHPDQSPTMRLGRSAQAFVRLPALLRRGAFRLLYRLPPQQKSLAGTVGLTAVGMVGRGGGWGTAFQVHPLEVVVGGITVRPGYAPSHGASTPDRDSHAPGGGGGAPGGGGGAGDDDVPASRDAAVPEPRELLALTLHFDHDVVDGAPAARFAARLRELVEAPDRVLGAVERHPS